MINFKKLTIKNIIGIILSFVAIVTLILFLSNFILVTNSHGDSLSIKGFELVFGLKEYELEHLNSIKSMITLVISVVSLLIIFVSGLLDLKKYEFYKNLILSLLAFFVLYSLNNVANQFKLTNNFANTVEISIFLRLLIIFSIILLIGNLILSLLNYINNNLINGLIKLALFLIILLGLFVNYGSTGNANGVLHMNGLNLIFGLNYSENSLNVISTTPSLIVLLFFCISIIGLLLTLINLIRNNELFSKIVNTLPLFLFVVLLNKDLFNVSSASNTTMSLNLYGYVMISSSLLLFLLTFIDEIKGYKSKDYVAYFIRVLELALVGLLSYNAVRLYTDYSAGNQYDKAFASYYDMINGENIADKYVNPMYIKIVFACVITGLLFNLFPSFKKSTNLLQFILFVTAAVILIKSPSTVFKSFLTKDSFSFLNLIDGAYYSIFTCILVAIGHLYLGCTLKESK